LGDNEAELLGRTLDRVLRVVGPPAPRVAARSFELKANCAVRRGFASNGVRPLARDKSQLGDMTKSVGRFSGDSERVYDVDAVGPRLHQAGREK
jgi:hypothetical protein